MTDSIKFEYQGTINMRILHVGNLASVGYYLCRGLRKKGHECDLFDWRTTNIISRSEESWIIKPADAGNSIHALKSISLNKYDLIHLHYLHNDTNLMLSLKYLLRAGTPVKVVHAHDSINDGTKDFVPRLKSSIVRFGAKKVFFSTPNIYENIKHFPQDKMFLPNPVDTELFKPLNTQVHKDRVLCWVKMDLDKGYEVIMEAIRKCPDIQFDIPRIGSLVPEFEGQLPENAHFIQPRSHDEAPALLNKYPAILEQFIVGAFGLSGLEAMACGVPVISYWKKGNDAFYQEPCPVVNARRPDEIAAAVKNTLANYKEIGQKSRNWVVKHHSIEASADLLAREYEKLF